MDSGGPGEAGRPYESVYKKLKTAQETGLRFKRARTIESEAFAEGLRPARGHGLFHRQHARGCCRMCVVIDG